MSTCGTAIGELFDSLLQAGFRLSIISQHPIYGHPDFRMHRLRGGANCVDALKRSLKVKCHRKPASNCTVALKVTSVRPGLRRQA